ncbi:MAG: FAD-binding oxidoreductase [Pseudomonadota bacterium]
MTTDTVDKLTSLRAALGDIEITDTPPAYLEDPRGRFQGQALGLVRPRSTEDVAQVVRAAAANRVPVVPYGGGTGLVGGQVSWDGPPPLIISLERMSGIRSVLTDEALLIAEAGAVLKSVQEAAAAAGLLFPLSLASEGSARIGGLLATNAGGVNVLRYGNARDMCLGLEAVMPDGSIWNGLKRLRKDNTGYDLRNLLIGSEGTLGIITAATLRLFPQPASHATAMLIVDSPKAALSLLSAARAHVGEQVSAFELIAGQGLEFLRETLPDVRLPFDAIPPWCVLIDLGLAARQDGQAALETLFTMGQENGWVTGGVIAVSEAQRQSLWSVREHIPQGNCRIGAIASHDVSLPLSAVPDFIEDARAELTGTSDLRINCFGHLGDGNLHFNLFPAKGRDRKDYDHQRHVLIRTVHDLVHAYGGSISAEHGIGRLKTSDLERYSDPTKLAAMRAIKHALDPHSIMNPGAVIRH